MSYLADTPCQSMTCARRGPIDGARDRFPPAGRTGCCPGPAFSFAGGGDIRSRMLTLPARFAVVALDLDGTLLTDDLQITERSHTAIRRVRECGVTVLLASARPPRSMMRYH